jgi:hypothetical protein
MEGEEDDAATDPSFLVESFVEFVLIEVHVSLTIEPSHRDTVRDTRSGE